MLFWPAPCPRKELAAASGVAVAGLGTEESVVVAGGIGKAGLVTDKAVAASRVVLPGLVAEKGNVAGRIVFPGSFAHDGIVAGGHAENPEGSVDADGGVIGSGYVAVARKVPRTLKCRWADTSIRASARQPALIRILKSSARPLEHGRKDGYDFQ